MSNSRSSNAVNNIIWGYVNKIVALFLPFVLRTVMLHVLGTEYLGLSSLFTSLLQMLNMADLGFSSAIVFSLYKPLAEKNEDVVCGLMEYYKRIYQIIGLVILIIGISLIPFLTKLIKGTVPKDINLVTIYLIYLVNTCLSYWLFAYKNALLQASQKMSVASNINSLINLIKFVFQILALYLTKSYYIYIFFLPIGTIAINIVSAIAANRLFPMYTHTGYLPAEIKKELTTQVRGVAVTKVCGVLRNSLDSVTISAFVNLTSVAIFDNYYYILNAVHGILTVITASIRAGVGNSIATESIEKNTNDFFMFDYLYRFIYSWCFICLICLYQSFMELWVGDGLKLPFITMLLFSFYFYSLCMCDIRNVYIEAGGYWWQYRIRAILETLANLILNVLFVNLWGIPGVIIATLLTYWAINVFYGTPIIFKAYFGIDKLFPLYKNNIIGFIKAVLISVIVYLICNMVPKGGFLLFSFRAVICAISALVFEVLLSFRSKEFEFVKAYAGKILMKIRA